MRIKQIKGFTLIELLIVVAIIAILVSIAYPSFNFAMVQARRTDAMADLLALQGAIERYYSVNSSYSGVIVSTASNATVAYPSIEGGAFYNYALSGAATATTYTIIATPIAGTSQVGDGFITLNQADVRGWDQNNDGAIGANESTWD